MPLVHPNSLSQTVDAINAAFFFGQNISARERESAATFLVSRHGQPRAYADTFALFPEELRAGIQLFTGERATCASARHIVGEEACRVLRLLDPRLPAAKAALAAACQALARRVGPAAPRGSKPDDGRIYWDWAYRGGTFCCGRCSVGFWRNILAGSFDRRETRLARGLKCLRDCRSRDHQWRRFPFWYTLCALIEMPPMKAAVDEMRHAAARAEPFAQRRSDNPITLRRSEIARRLLAMV